MGRFISCCFIIFFVFTGHDLSGQRDHRGDMDSLPIPVMDINKISLSETLENKIEFSYLDFNNSLTEKYQSINFGRDAIPTRHVPDNYVTKKAILRFRICNSSDSARSVWFFPGLYYWDSQLYEETKNGLKKIGSVQPEGLKEISYRLITLPPKDSATIVAELSFVRTHLNAVKPTLIHPAYLSSFVKNLDATNSGSKVVTYLFCGLMMMMILFSLASYSQGGKTEFLYYSGYAFFLGTMLFIKAIHSYHTSWFAFFQETYLDLVMQNTGIVMYMIFMQKYLSTRQDHPFLHKLYRSGIILVITSTAAFTYAHYFTNNFVLENQVENITKMVLLVMVAIFLIYSVRRWDNQWLRYLFWGNLSLFVFSLFSLLMITANIIPRNLPPVLKTSLFYYEIGLLLELIFFLLGLFHKNKKLLIEEARERERLKAKDQMNEYEKELAVYKAQQRERERISADMHDELGSGMTAIRLMSEIARNKMKEQTPVEIEKISQSADEVLNKMNAIIWSMNSNNDTIDNLVSYIRSYALEYFDNTPISCKITTPEYIEPSELSGDKRRNIFLSVKETLNNALKHSKASEITIDFDIGNMLTIVITDNGVGFDFKKIRQFGNGLKNIANRIENIGGTYKIEGDSGTRSTFRIPL